MLVFLSFCNVKFVVVKDNVNNGDNGELVSPGDTSPVTMLEETPCHPESSIVAAEQPQQPGPEIQPPPLPPFDGLSVVDEETCEDTSQNSASPPPAMSTPNPPPAPSPPLQTETDPRASFYGTIVLPNGKRAVYFSDQVRIYTSLTIPPVIYHTQVLILTLGI